MAKGTYGAYRQLTPIREDFGGNMERAADRFMRIQDKDLAFKEARRKEHQEILSKFGEDMASLEQVISGVQSIDEVNYDYFNQGQRALGDMYRQLRENPSLARDPQFMMRKQQILRSPQILKAFQEKTTARIEELSKGLANDDLSKVMMEELDELKSYYGVRQKDGSYSPNFVLRYDKQGNTYALVKRPDGKLVARSAPSVINGFEYSETINKVNPLDLTNNFIKSIGPDETLKNVPGGKAIVQEWDLNKQQTAERYYDNLLNMDGEPSAVAKSLWVDYMGNDSLEDINVAQIRSEMVNATKESYGNKIKSFSRTPQRKTGSREKDPAWVRSRINVMTDTKGGVLVENITFTPEKGKEPVRGIGFTIPPVELPWGEGGEATVTSLFYDQESGDVWMRGMEKQGRVYPNLETQEEGGTRSTWAPFTRLNGAQLSEVASKLYLKDAGELVEIFQERLNKPGDTSKGQVTTPSGRTYKVKQN